MKVPAIARGFGSSAGDGLQWVPSGGETDADFAYVVADCLPLNLVSGSFV